MKIKINWLRYIKSRNGRVILTSTVHCHGVHYQYVFGSNPIIYNLILLCHVIEILLRNIGRVKSGGTLLRRTIYLLVYVAALLKSFKIINTI